MTDKLLIEALENCKAALASADPVRFHWEVTQATKAIAAHRSQQEVAQEPRLCGFCGKSQHQVKKLLATPCAAICDECNQTAGRVLGTSTAPSESEAKDAARYRWLLAHLWVGDFKFERNGRDLRVIKLEVKPTVTTGLHMRREVTSGIDQAMDIDAALSAPGQKGEPT